MTNAIRIWALSRIGPIASSEAWTAKAVRFAVIGLLSSLTFALTTSAVIVFFSTDPKIASMIGYILAMPVNFAGNRTFSFRSKGSIWKDMIRFLLLHSASMALTAAIMTVSVDILQLHYTVGVAATCILVPIANFLAMNLWVFARRKLDAPSR